MRSIRVVLSILVLAGCSLGVEDAPGSIIVLAGVPGNVTASTLVPQVDLDATEFSLVATGESGDSRTAASTTPLMELSGVVPGRWDLAVVAHNGAGIPILTGSTRIHVEPASRTSAVVTLEPLSGTGTFEIELLWPDRGVVDPAATATLTKGASVAEVPLDCGSSGCAGGIEGVPAGYHLLSVDVADSNRRVTGVAESVRILAGQTTRGIYDFSTQAGRFRGDIELTLTVDNRSPLEPEIVGLPTRVYAGEVLAVRLGGSVPVVESAWYRWGEKLGDGPTTILNVSPESERERLTVFCRSGSRAGSASVDIDVIPITPVGGLVFGASTDSARFSEPRSTAVTGSHVVTGDNAAGETWAFTVDPTGAPVIESYRMLFDEYSIVRGRDGSIWAVSPSAVRRYVAGAGPALSEQSYAERVGSGAAVPAVCEGGEVAFVVDGERIERLWVQEGSLLARSAIIDGLPVEADVRGAAATGLDEVVLCDFAGDSLIRVAWDGSGASPSATVVATHADGIGGVDGLNGVGDVVVVGNDMYACSYYDSAVAWFRRTDGDYAFMGILDDVATGATSMAILGDLILVAAGVGDSLVVIERNGETGEIALVGVIADDAGGLDSPRSVGASDAHGGVVAIASANSGTVDLIRGYRSGPVE